MGVMWTKEQRNVITLRNKNLLVSAAAGSGKTAVLVERIIRMLTDEEHPVDVDRLLIVTFTEAAAAEMKERIRAAIEKKLLQDPDNEHLKQQAAFIHGAQITTIHSFCLSVIRDHFPAIGLDPGFRVGEEGELKLLQHDVLEEVLEEKYREGGARFLEFSSAYGTGRDDRKIEDLILRTYEYSRSYPDSEGWLASCEALYGIKDEEGFLDSPFVRFACENSKAYLEDAKNLVSTAIKICREPDGPMVYEGMLEADMEILEALCKASDYRALAEGIQKPGWVRMPINRDKTVSEEKMGQVKYVRSEVKAIVGDLQKQFFARDIPQMITAFAGCYPMVQELVDLVRRFSISFEQKKRGKNLIDFSDMEQYALRILTVKTEDGPAPSVIAKEYQEQFLEVMVDEYQDSSLVQEAILASVSRESQGEYNRFMVGDVKQSIYRFRLSRPELFLEKLHTYGTDEGDMQRIDLHKNFRSRKEVIDSVNAVFGQIMTASLGGVSYDAQAALYAGADYPENTALTTEVLVVDGKVEEEARAIAGRIRALIRDFRVTDPATGKLRDVRYRDIVILTRSVKGYADVMMEVLDQEGIPAVSGTKEGYFSTQEIGVLLDYLRVLNNRKQDIPLAAALASPIAGCGAEDLAAVRIAYPEAPFHEAAVLYAQQGEDASVREKLAHFFQVLDSLRERVPYTPMHELLMAVLSETGYGDYAAAMPGGEQRKANIEMLVEKARTFESTSYQGLFHFVRYMEQIQKYDVDYGEAGVEDGQSDAVRMMTIHKSKGLEFPVVFVAGLGKMFNQQDARSKAVLHPKLGIGLDWVDLEAHTRMATLAKKVMQKEEALETLGEELRILYVAMTRAKEKMILTGTMKSIPKKMEQYRLACMQKEKTISFGRLSRACGYWDWLIPALLRLGDDAPFVLSVVAPGELAKKDAREEWKSRFSKSMFEKWDDGKIYDEKAKAFFEEQFTYRYPYREGQNQKMKYTVSELKKRPHLQEGGEEAGELLYQEPEVVPLLPRFLDPQQESLDGARKGTVYHRALELFDFQREYPTPESVGEALESFAAQGKMTREEAAAVHIPDIWAFLQSLLGRRMRQAAASGRLWREQPFVLGVEADKGTDWVFIQGIIDVFFEEEDALVLLDYKTDRVLEGKELAERYHAQLDYYGRALEQITGKRVKERWIYSFALGEEILV